MYGPQGGHWWSDYDANGNPILLQNPDAEENADLVNEYGLWRWTLAGHADNVDHTKFAVNEAMPADQRSWVVSHQANTFTPLMRPLTDEYANIGNIIEPDSELGIARTANYEYMREVYPQIITAPTAEAAQALIDDILAFYDANRMPEIIAQHRIVYAENLAIQGGSIFIR